MTNRELETRYTQMKLTWKDLVNANIDLLDENKMLKEENEQLNKEIERLNNIIKNIEKCIDYYAIENDDFSKFYNNEEIEILKIIGSDKE